MALGFVGEGRCSPPASDVSQALPTTRPARGSDFGLRRKTNGVCKASQDRAAPRRRKRHHRFLFRLEQIPILYFVRLTEILNDPLFRLTKESK
jgi:hypothetical protein